MSNIGGLIVEILDYLRTRIPPGDLWGNVVQTLPHSNTQNIRQETRNLGILET